MKQIAFIGLGNMGRPMAANLLKAGFSLTVHNRHPKKTADLAALGARVADNIPDAVRDAEATIIMVSDDAAVRAVVYGPDGVLDSAPGGHIVINMSTVSPDLSREIAQTAGEKGVFFLDAPVSGSVKPATDGTLVILVGGEQPVFEQSLPMLQAMGKDVFYLGPNGAGSHMKLCINMLLGITMQGVAEAIVLAEKGGLGREQMLNVINASAVQTPLVKLKTPSYLAGEYPAAFALKHMSKDFGLALVQAQALNVTLPATAAGNETFKAAKNEGYADLDLAAVIKLLERLGGLNQQ